MKRSVLILSGLAALASCQPLHQDYPVAFVSNVSEFKVFAREVGEEAFNFLYAVEVSGDKYAPLRKWHADDRADFYAYSPLTATVYDFATNADEPAIRYTVPQKDENLKVAATSGHGGAKVLLNFRPALSTIRFEFVNNTSELTIYILSLRLYNIANKGTLNLADINDKIEWTPTNTTNISFELDKNLPLLPQTVESIAEGGNYTLESEFTGETLSYLAIQTRVEQSGAVAWHIRPIVLDGGNTFKAGKAYLCTVSTVGNFTGDGINVNIAELP